MEGIINRIVLSIAFTNDNIGFAPKLKLAYIQRTQLDFSFLLCSIFSSALSLLIPPLVLSLLNLLRAWVEQRWLQSSSHLNRI